jgi:hypothetical protein
VRRYVSRLSSQWPCFGGGAQKRVRSGNSLKAVALYHISQYKSNALGRCESSATFTVHSRNVRVVLTELLAASSLYRLVESQCHSSNPNLLHLVQVHVVIAPVVETCCPRRLVGRDLLRNLQLPAVLEIRGNAGRPECVVSILVLIPVPLARLRIIW